MNQKDRESVIGSVNPRRCIIYIRRQLGEGVDRKEAYSKCAEIAKVTYQDVVNLYEAYENQKRIKTKEWAEEYGKKVVELNFPLLSGMKFLDEYDVPDFRDELTELSCIKWVKDIIGPCCFAFYEGGSVRIWDTPKGSWVGETLVQVAIKAIEEHCRRVKA